MKEKLSRIVSTLGIVLFLSIGFTQCVEISEDAPDNAIVLVDDKNKIYHSPIHFEGAGIVDGLRQTTAGEVRSKKYKKDPACGGDFSQERGSLLKSTLSNWTGLAAESRWNEDGSWKW